MNHDKETEDALDGSIAKWEAIVAGTGVDDGWTNCPLCEEFFMNDCRDCPVMERTGKNSCHGSPYEQWVDHCDPEFLSGSYKVFDDESRRLAQSELDFLRSLK